MDIPPRSIIREDAFEDELRLLIADAEEADEFTAAAEWVLAHEPHAGTLADDGPPAVWVLPMQPADNEAIWLLYTFDESTVIFLGLRRI